MKHRIQQVRKDKGLTQEDLAAKLGMTRQGLSAIEHSDSVTLKTLEKISRALSCPVYELLDVGDPVSFDTPEDYEEYRKNQTESEEKAYTEYMKRLGVPVRHLNQLGREALLDSAEMMSHHEKYSNTINIAIDKDGNETITFGEQD